MIKRKLEWLRGGILNVVFREGFCVYRIGNEVREGVVWICGKRIF